MQYFRPITVTIGAFILASAGSAPGGTIETFDEFDPWQNEAGPFTTIQFLGAGELVEGTVVTDQFIDEGVIFAGWDEACQYCGKFFPGFSQDPWGINAGENADIRFTQPMTTFAAHFPGAMDFTVYNGDDIVFTTQFSDFMDNSNFGGFVSDQPFDRVVLHNPNFVPNVIWTYVDNIYFGPPIPAPGVLVVFAVGLGMSGAPRRRRNG